MVLPGMNPETNLPGYDYARMAGLGAADFDFKALGSAMDCNREFAQAGIIYSDGAQRYLVRSGQRHPNGQSGIVTHVIAGGALKEAVTTWRAMKSISSLKATEWLKNYPRQDRARLTELIIRAQNPGISNKEIKALIRAGLYPKRFPTGPVQVELTRQLGQVVTSAAALAGSAVSGVIAAPSNLPRTGKYIIGTIQSLAVF
ncbi:hypothetical protein [Enterobacter asburiae]|uniref:hypothetical protein n=1 Tax=Enterobacter asburiae TaxID=61645 RepID=UPI002003767B|nr:hypothetical protein [Enterobacter asburiae]MCK7419616.1 hypothetical protein [Enterobacter asburiae]